MFTYIVIGGAVGAFCYAHWKLHLSIAQIKADLAADLAAIKAKLGL